MKSNGYEKTTLIGISRRLKHLDRHTDLNNPKSVVTFIMNKKATNGYKNNLSIAYLHFARFHKLDYKLNILKHKSKHIRIPTTEELNSLINSAHNPLSLKLKVLKETGLRPIELTMLKTNDVDIERKTIYPTTAKNGSARTLKISNRLATLLQTYIIKHDRNPNSLLFNTKQKALRTNYSVSRNRTTKKLGNPRLSKIRLYDFRHYYATQLYARTKDILYVQKQMGHKNLRNTLIYTQLIQFDEDENFTCKVAQTQQQMTDLIEHGFTFIHEKDGLAYFALRSPKEKKTEKNIATTKPKTKTFLFKHFHT